MGQHFRAHHFHDPFLITRLNLLVGLCNGEDFLADALDQDVRRLLGIAQAKLKCKSRGQKGNYSFQGYLHQESDRVLRSNTQGRE